MANVLPREQQIAVLQHLVEGNTLRSTSRLTGTHRTTIQNLLLSFGDRCQAFMERELRGLTLTHLEVDEMWTFVAKKQGRLTVDEKQVRSDIGDQYLWYAIDQPTKLVPGFVLGKRSADNARRLMMQLAGRLVLPKPHASDRHAYERPDQTSVVQISTDGFAAYPEAVDLGFGPYAKFGTIVKDYRNADQPGRYAPPEMVGTVRRARRGLDAGDLWTICTSHVERANLTVRTLLKRFTRLGLGFSKSFDHLNAACAMYFAFYNWCWRTRDAENGGYRLPAAIAAGVTDRLWSFEDLYDGVSSK